MKELTESSHACSYAAPTLEVVEIRIEKGFAESYHGLGTENYEQKEGVW